MTNPHERSPSDIPAHHSLEQLTGEIRALRRAFCKVHGIEFEEVPVRLDSDPHTRQERLRRALESARPR